MYGGWINPKGEIIEVENKCRHKTVMNYDEGDDEGWVCYTNSSSCGSSDGGTYGMSARFNPLTVTDLAIKTLLKLISQSGEEAIHLSDMWNEDFKGCSQGVTKTEARKLIRNRTKLETRF